MIEHWEWLADGLHVLRDSCLVYAVRGPSGTVIVNAGTGLAAEHLDEVTGAGEKLDALIGLLHNYGEVEMIRSGAMAMGRSPKVDHREAFAEASRVPVKVREPVEV